MLTKEQANLIADETMARQRKISEERKYRRLRIAYWYQVAGLRSLEPEKQFELFRYAKRLVIKDIYCWILLTLFFSCIGYWFYLGFPQSMKFAFGAVICAYLGSTLIRLPFLRWYLTKLVQAAIGAKGSNAN